jgi:argininosuccinate synthase
MAKPNQTKTKIIAQLQDKIQDVEYKAESLAIEFVNGEICECELLDKMEKTKLIKEVLEAVLEDIEEL